MAKPKTTSTALAVWNERLASLAKQNKQAVAGIGGGGSFISLKGGIMTYQKAVIPGNKLNAIIIDWIFENQEYDGQFDEENFSAPICFAFGREKSEMVPNSEDVENPINPEGC